MERTTFGLLKNLDYLLFQKLKRSKEPLFRELWDLATFGKARGFHDWTVPEHTARILKDFEDPAALVDVSERTRIAIREYLNKELDGISKRQLFKLAIVLHDIGKKTALEREGAGSNHPRYSAQMVPDIAQRFGLTTKQISYVQDIVENHQRLSQVDQHKKTAQELKAAQPSLFVEIALFTIFDQENTLTREHKIKKGVLEADGQRRESIVQLLEDWAKK